MEERLSSIGKVLYRNNKHIGFSLEWQTIAPFCKKWSGNRDPDMQRVAEMMQFHLAGGYLPRIIHLAEISGEGLAIYDGNHRSEVFRQCNEAGLIVTVDVMFDTTNEEVYHAFNDINKAVQVPSIYFEQLNGVKDEILQLVRQYEMCYPNFVSTSSKCLAPNFNRDNFIENLFSIYKQFEGRLSVQDMNLVLQELNTVFGKGELRVGVYSERIISKCKKFNFWLFMNKTICSNHVKEVWHMMQKN